MTQKTRVEPSKPVVYDGGGSHLRKLGQWLREQEHQNALVLAVLAFLMGYWIVYKYNLGIVGIIQIVQGGQGDPRWVAAVTKRDPAVGTVVELPLFRGEGQSIRLPESSGLTAIVFLTNCQECASRDELLRLDTLVRQFPEIRFYIAVMAGDYERAKAILRKSITVIPVVCDVNGTAAKKLNAYFNFRGYLLDPDGRLLYVTQRNQPIEKIQEDIVRLVQKSRVGSSVQGP